MKATLLLLPLVAVVGCSSSGKEPAVASAGGHAAYAVRYDEELTSATKAFSDAQANEKKLSGGFAAHVDKLSKPDWGKVEAIIDDSDDAGKSADFAEASNDANAIKNFWDSEKNDITARVSGTATKEAGCSAESGGVIGAAMTEAVNRRIQKRLHARNDAFVVIDRYRTSLGPQNVQSLEKLADDVSEASYDVHVLMVLQRTRLQRLVKDKDDVKKTLDRYVQEETAFQAEPGRTDAEKKASADRATAANKKKGEMDNIAAQADAMVKDMDKSIDASTKDYEEALKSLKTKVADKKKAEPAGKEPAKTASAN